MTKVFVNNQEAGAFRRFRSSADSLQIKNVIMREIAITREQYESEVANEDTRTYLQLCKRVLNLLYVDDLIRKEKA